MALHWQSVLLALLRVPNCKVAGKNGARREGPNMEFRLFGVAMSPLPVETLPKNTQGTVPGWLLMAMHVGFGPFC